MRGGEREESFFGGIKKERCKERVIILKREPLCRKTLMRCLYVKDGLEEKKMGPITGGKV